MQSVASVNDEMPSSVEGFSYPGADQVFEERGIKLKRGDGRLLFVECSTAYDVMVESLAGRAGYCFKATGKHGFLTMELAGAYHIWTEGHPVRAKLTAEGETTTVDVPKNAFRPVGEADSTTGRKRSVLVELRITG
ncbi:hypothetical protein [Streptomyces sp. C10-9-1]|uniref:hypothetical protein n=1 Tax=Streptomyces sp. C10-9-1 TaxID=1859285 RepID=UPI003D734230